MSNEVSLEGKMREVGGVREREQAGCVSKDLQDFQN